MKCSTATLDREHETIFRWRLRPDLTQHFNTSCSEGHGHSNDSQPYSNGSDLSPFLCFPPPFHLRSSKNTCTLKLMSKLHWESRERFTLPLKINDTGKIADGCNQKFKQQAASLSLSLLLSRDCQIELQQCALCKTRPVCLIILSPFNLKQSHSLS